MEAEFAAPQWVFGLSHFDIDTDGTIVATALAVGRTTLLVLRDDEPPRDPEGTLDKPGEAGPVSGQTRGPGPARNGARPNPR